MDNLKQRVEARVAALQIDADSISIDANIKFWRSTFSLEGLDRLSSLLSTASHSTPTPAPITNFFAIQCEELDPLHELLIRFSRLWLARTSRTISWNKNNSAASFSQLYLELCSDPESLGPTAHDTYIAAGIPFAPSGRSDDVLNDYILGRVGGRLRLGSNRTESDRIIFRAVEEGAAALVIQMMLGDGILMFLDMDALTHLRKQDRRLFDTVVEVVARQIPNTIRVGRILGTVIFEPLSHERRLDSRLATLASNASRSGSSLFDCVLSDEMRAIADELRSQSQAAEPVSGEIP